MVMIENVLSPEGTVVEETEDSHEKCVVLPAPSQRSKATEETVALSPKALAPEAAVVGVEEDFEPDPLMKFLLCAVAMLEGADVAVLGPCLFALQRDIGLKFTDLAYLGVAQAVCTNIAAPLWGILADRGTVSRKKILIVGSLGQGLVTVMLAVVTQMTPMIFLRALNGIMLASLRPISNGIVADCTSDGRRGSVFGKIQSALVVGMLASTLLAGPIANKQIFGIQGWRVAFVLVGSVSLIVSTLLCLFFKEPPHDEDEEQDTKRKGLGAVVDEMRSLAKFFSIPTFCIMIMQGIFGTIPWTVMGNQMLFFQLSGLSDEEATLLSTEQLIVGIFGNLLGGYVADALARKFGYHGRPLNAQITVGVGIPLIYMMYSGIEPGQGTLVTYGLLILAWGLLGCWAQSGTNFPILAEIVPANARSRVMAWECALENSIANAVGPPVVAFLATYCFGYTFGEETADDGENLHSAQALGKAMTAVIVGPSFVCFLAYSLLHYTYPRDVKKLAAETMVRKQSSEAKKQEAGAKAAETIVAL